MKVSPKIIIILFILIIFISISLNLPEGFNSSPPTRKNLIGSLLFLMNWFIFNMYISLKKEKKYTTFIVIYWTMSFIPLIYLYLSAFFPNIYTPYLSAFWFGIPMYGLLYQFEISSITFCLINPISGITISLLGYLLGLKIKKVAQHKI